MLIMIILKVILHLFEEILEQEEILDEETDGIDDDFFNDKCSITLSITSKIIYWYPLSKSDCPYNWK